jgi:hypothetical protein
MSDLVARLQDAEPNETLLVFRLRPMQLWALLTELQFAALCVGGLNGHDQRNAQMLMDSISAQCGNEKGELPDGE